MTKLATTDRSAGCAYAMLLLTAASWGVNTVLGRLAVGEVSPMLLVTLRWLVVTVLLSIFAKKAAREGWAALRPNQAFVFAMGGLGFAAFNALYYTAAHTTTAINMGIVQGSIPVFVVVGAFVVEGAGVSLKQGLGIAVSLLGVAVVASAGQLTRLAKVGVNSGDLLMLVACTLYAGYTLALRRRPDVSALALLTLMAGAGFAVSLPLAAVEWAAGRLQLPSPTGWAIVAAVAVVPSLLAQACYMHGVRLIGPARAGVFVNLVPVFAAILGATVLSESLELHHTLALGLVLGGIWLSERQARGSLPAR